MAPALQTANLGKIFPGGLAAVTALDLEVGRGEVYGLMGRNGAGKTTTLRLLMGLLRPTSGEAKILGESLMDAGRTLRGRVAYVSQSQHLPGWMTLRELSRYSQHLYPGWNKRYFEHVCQKWQLPGGRMLSSFSGGEQRKAALLLALAARPEVLLLDEPAGGLDPVSRRETLNEIVEALNERPATTILLATHHIADLERIAQRIGILDRGRLILDRDLDEIRAAFRRVQVIFPGESAPPHFSIFGARKCVVSGPVVCGVTEYFDTEHLEALNRWPGVRVQVFPLGLEEIFFELSAECAGAGGDELETEEAEGRDTKSNFFDSDQLQSR